MSVQQPVFDGSKWKDSFVNLLRDIPRNQFPHIGIGQNEALEFIEELLVKLMSLVMEKNPHSVQDLEKIINSILKWPINEYANKKAERVLNECLETNQYSSLIQIIHQLSNSSSISNQQARVNLANCSLIMCPIIERIQKNCGLDSPTSVYMCALLEYIADDIFKLVCKYVENIGNNRIKLQDVQIALNADNLLMELFYGKNEHGTCDCDEPLFSLIDDLSNLEVSDESRNGEGGDVNSVHTYVNIVKELIKEERSFLRELNLIIKVFREPFIRLLKASNSMPGTPTISTSNNFNSLTNHSELIATAGTVNDNPIISEDDIKKIFSNVLDIYEFSTDFLVLIEDTIEMNEESEGIGYCFEEMAENQEFDVFQTFAEELFEEGKKENKQPHHHLKELFENQRLVSCLSTSGKGVLLCIKYVLPKLLNGVIVHCLHYFEYIKFLMVNSPNEDDRESLQQSEGLIGQLKSFLKHVKVGRNFKLNEGYLKLTKTHREKQYKNVRTKLDEMSKKIDGFNSPQYNQVCNEFIYEGILSIVRKGDRRGLKNIHENRNECYCFLFDGLLVCCKILHNSPAEGDNAKNFDFKMKDIYSLRNLEVCDGDSEVTFELVYNKVKEHKEVLILLAKSTEEKEIWISNLLLLTQKPIIERTVDSILSEEELRIPLKLPNPKQYRFAEKDNELNIVFDSSSGKDLIKEATLTKLIERLTYHQFADPKLWKTFLITYRSFCTPKELFDLLIERFNIPFEDDQASNSSLSREELKRFKKEYLEPIQLRVLNALKLWVESHYYDFDGELKEQLKKFLEDQQKNKQRKHLKKWVDNLLLRIEKKESACEEKKHKYLCENLPPVLHWLEKERKVFNLLTIHPVEFSRQLTLYEFDLYCAVDPFELIGAKWQMKDKLIHSPNIVKLTEHTNNFTYWIEREIIECPNLEERQAMVARLHEMLQALHDLNNFAGIYEIVGALNSACVVRLDCTLKDSHKEAKRIKTIDDCFKMLEDPHGQLYLKRLRSINPPCVPFFGRYLTDAIHSGALKDIDNKDDKKQLINFSKCRNLAEISSEIQQYQNQPYYLNVYPQLRDFIANLDPLQGQTVNDFETNLYKLSKEIEPKDPNEKKTYAVAAPRKYPDLPLKLLSVKQSHISNLSSLHHSISSVNNAIVANHNH